MDSLKDFELATFGINSGEAFAVAVFL